MPLFLKERLQSYLGPLTPLSFSVRYLFQNLSTGLHDIGDRTFATWYLTLGDGIAAYESTTAVPHLVGLANGTVLELGPGSGLQFTRFNRSAISRIYGIEPNEYLFEKLRDEIIEKHDLGDIYIPIKAALEDSDILESQGIGAESVDTIVCMQVMCSVTDPNRAAKEMYRLLKPGGQLLFWEHQASQDRVTKIAQKFWNLLWTPLLGGCRLNADVEKALLSAGKWEIVELDHGDDEPFRLRPRVWGKFVKA